MLAYTTFRDTTESVAQIQILCTFQADFEARPSSIFHGA